MPRSLVLCFFSLLCILLCSTASFAADAEDIEFSTLNCQQFVTALGQMDEESAGYVLMWIDGYLSGVTGDTLLHWDGLETFGVDLVDFCQRNPHSGLLDAAKAKGIRR